jgi:hypothetical protein
MHRQKIVSRSGLALVAVTSALFASTSLPSVHATVAPATVHAEGGILATAGITQITPRGVWTFDVTLVVPQGSTTSSGAVLPSGIDMSRPWVAVSLRSPYSGGSCGNFANPVGYSAGEQQGNRWVGTYVDVACNDGSGYEFFRITWPAKLGIVSNPVSFALRGVDPAQFSTPTADGLIHAWPDFEQKDFPTLCGHRPWVGWECFGDGTGHVQKSSTGILTTAVVG